MKDTRLYISNIKECIEAIDIYTTEGKNTFMQTRIIQDAVMRNFEIIGEATKRLTLEFREQHPDIEWRKLAGLRDVLIHDYLRVDLEEIWLIIEQDLPSLKVKIEEIWTQFNQS